MFMTNFTTDWQFECYFIPIPLQIPLGPQMDLILDTHTLCRIYTQAFNVCWYDIDTDSKLRRYKTYTGISIKSVLSGTVWNVVYVSSKIYVSLWPYAEQQNCVMMTSSNGNIFRVTGPLCGEFTGPGEFPTQRPVTRSCDVFFDLRLNKRLSKQPWGWWSETPSSSLWRHRNGATAI